MSPKIIILKKSKENVLKVNGELVSLSSTNATTPDIPRLDDHLMMVQ